MFSHKAIQMCMLLNKSIMMTVVFPTHMSREIAIKNVDKL